MSDGLPSNIIEARTRAEQAGQQAGAYGSQLPTVGDVLKERVTKIFNENQDIFNQFNPAVTNLVEAPGQSYEMFKGVTDPYARERLASGYVATQSLPAMGLASQLGQRVGTTADIVQGGVNAFTAQATAVANAANLARQNYQDILNEFMQQENLRMQQEQLAISRASAGKVSAGESQAAEIKKLIQEASKLPANKRAQYIMSNGYNPYEATFAGVVPSAESVSDQLKQAQLIEQNLKNQAAQQATQPKKSAWDYAMQGFSNPIGALKFW